MLKLLHTADWHVGKRFPMFDEESQKKLSRARLDVVGRILDTARRSQVDAVLCAGDLFDDPNPSADYWEGLAKQFTDKFTDGHGKQPPVILLPGNHDPLTPESVWSPTHPLRQRLPAWVHVVDRDDFSLNLGSEAVLYARPCRSKAGQEDPALLLPAREPGDNRLRIGMVHGSTVEIKGHQTNFPISREAGIKRGLDYLAIGDTHSFRDVTANLPVPTVYPGAPEPTGFDEPEAGQIVLVSLFRHGSRPRVFPEPIAAWKWMDSACRDLNELRALLTTPTLERCVVRLRLDMTVTVAEESEVDRILRELKGTEASHGRAGILVVDRSGLRLRASGSLFSHDLPPVLQDVWARLEALVSQASDEAERELAVRAQSHLYKLIQKEAAL